MRRRRSARQKFGRLRPSPARTSPIAHSCRHDLLWRRALRGRQLQWARVLLGILSEHQWPHGREGQGAQRDWPFQWENLEGAERKQPHSDFELGEGLHLRGRRHQCARPTLEDEEQDRAEFEVSALG